MSDDYLWDRSGEPDPEVARLESLLGRYRHETPLRQGPKRTRWIAAAALLILMIGAGFFAYRFLWPAGESWPVTIVSGTPTIDGRPAQRLGVDQELRTDAHSRAIVQVARVGEVEIGPSSNITLVSTRSRRHRLRLDRGTIVARTWAPPFTFSVDTPSGLASDIGCAFTLQHDEQSGSVHVTSGWVDFDGDDRSALIPAGARVELRGDNPGTPFYDDATPAFRAALRAFDFGSGSLDAVIEAARPRDAMSLLHLLERVEPAHRPLLFDALSTIAPPPAGVTREGVLARDLKMLEAWRQSLGLGGVKRWWLYWRDAF